MRTTSRQRHSQRARGWSVLDHPAEIGLRVWGATLRQLFTHAAQGMFAILTGGAAVRGVTRRFTVHVEATTTEELLVAWLRELLFRVECHRLIARRWRFTRCDARRVRAEVTAVRWDPQRQPLGVEIKAATYHQLRIVRRGGRYHTRIIFDV